MSTQMWQIVTLFDIFVTYSQTRVFVNNQVCYNQVSLNVKELPLCLSLALVWLYISISSSNADVGKESFFLTIF
jgi:hypothetical protein